MRAWWLAVSLVGCGDKDDSGVAPLYQYNECESEVAPVLTDLYCESTGLKVYPETGEEVPTLTVTADVADEEGDLTSYTVQLLFDDVLDGVVDADSATAMPIAEGSYHAEVCEVPSLILNMVVYLRGGEPLYDTTYEWGMQVTDAAGNASEIGVVECTTPSEPSGDTQ